MSAKRDAQNRLVNQVREIAKYWANETRAKSRLDVADGVAFGILVLLDGVSIGSRTYSVREVKERGGHSPNLSGDLHDLYHMEQRQKRRASDKEALGRVFKLPSKGRLWFCKIRMGFTDLLCAKPETRTRAFERVSSEVTVPIRTLRKLFIQWEHKGDLAVVDFVTHRISKSIGGKAS
jgi:hypothetical protein